MMIRALVFGYVILTALVATAQTGPVAWFDTEKVRTAYHYGRPPVVERIEKLRQVGINCMILKCDTTRALPWLPEARKRGMHVFLALNFNVKAVDKGFRRAVLDSGATEAYACPLEERFWQDHLTPAVMDRVKLSKDPRYEVSGLWIDFELYSTTTGQRYYTHACYCQHCFAQFCRHLGVETPDLEAKERSHWLKEQGHADRYQPYLQTQIERFSSALRSKVHAANSAFLLGFYPTPRNWSLVGVARGFATERVPILLWATDTYGGGGADRLPEHWREHYTELGINARYIAGLLLRRYSAANLAANLYHTSQKCDGYWLFTTYTLNNPVAEHRGDYYLASGTPAAYWQAIRLGNDEIEKGLAAGPTYQTQLQVGPEPIAHPMLHRPELRKRLLRTVPPPATEKRTDLPRVLLRGTNILVIAGQAKCPIELTLGFYPVRDGKEAIAWRAIDMDGNSIASGRSPKGAPAQVHLVPREDGILFILASAGTSCWYATETNAPVGLYAGANLHTMYGATQLYFRVPEHVDRFTIVAKGASGRETVRVDTLNPDGKIVASAQSNGHQQEITLESAVGKYAGRVWSLTIDKAREGILEDSTISLPFPLPPILSLLPEHAFGVRKE